MSGQKFRVPLHPDRKTIAASVLKGLDHAVFRPGGGNEVASHVF